MKQKAVLIVAITLFSFAMAMGSALSSVAENMSVGTFAEVKTDSSKVFYLGGRGTVFAFSNGGSWDPHSRQMLQIGAPHGSAMEFVRYQESDNRWYLDTTMPYGTDGWVGAHTYDHLTIDSSGIFYHIYWQTGITYRYDAPNAQWLDPLPTTMGSYGCLDYSSDLNALLRFSRGRIFVYRINEGKWDTINTGLSIESDYESVAAYSPAGKMLLFGGGSGNARDIYKMDTSLVVTRLNDAPFNVRINSSWLVADPVTGTIIAFTADSLYGYNHRTDKWYSFARNVLPAAELGVIPISTYGVIALCTYSSRPVLLYKFAEHPWSANPATAATIHANADTLGDLNWSTKVRIHAEIASYGTDTGNTGAHFFCLDTGIAKVTPDGIVKANHNATGGLVRIVATRLGDWINDTCEIWVNGSGMKDIAYLSGQNIRMGSGCWAGHNRIDTNIVYDGISYERSMSLIAPSFNVFYLGKRYDRLYTYFGSALSSGATFYAVLDGDTVYRSDDKSSKSYIEALNLNVEGVDTLVLGSKASNNLGWCATNTVAVWATPIVYNIDTTGISSVLKMATFDEPNSVKADPSPFNPSVRLTLTGALKVGASVKVYGLNGKLVADISRSVVGGRVTWTAPKNGSGIYLAVVQKGSLKITKKLIYSK